MTGQELFAALSFVDGKYVQEAETAKLGRNTPWLKVLSVAACLCILLATVEMQRYSLQGISCCMGYGDYPVKL